MLFESVEGEQEAEPKKSTPLDPAAARVNRKKQRENHQVSLMTSFLEDGNPSKLREMLNDLSNLSSDSEKSEEKFEPKEELLRFAPKLTQNRLQKLIDEAQSKFPFKDSFLSYLRDKKSVKRSNGGSSPNGAKEATGQGEKGGKRYKSVDGGKVRAHIRAAIQSRGRDRYRERMKNKGLLQRIS